MAEKYGNLKKSLLLLSVPMFSVSFGTYGYQYAWGISLSRDLTIMTICLLAISAITMALTIILRGEPFDTLKNYLGKSRLWQDCNSKYQVVIIATVGILLGIIFFMIPFTLLRTDLPFIASVLGVGAPIFLLGCLMFFFLHDCFEISTERGGFLGWQFTNVDHCFECSLILEVIALAFFFLLSIAAPALFFLGAPAPMLRELGFIGVMILAGSISIFCFYKLITTAPKALSELKQEVWALFRANNLSIEERVVSETLSGGLKTDLNTNNEIINITTDNDTKNENMVTLQKC